MALMTALAVFSLAVVEMASASAVTAILVIDLVTIPPVIDLGVILMTVA